MRNTQVSDHVRAKPSDPALPELLRVLLFPELHGADKAGREVDTSSLVCLNYDFVQCQLGCTPGIGEI